MAERAKLPSAADVWRLCARLVLLGSLAVVRAQSQSTPGPAPCYADEEVLVASTAKDIQIAGTLSIPRGAGPHPAILMITGSGPHTRDQMISNSPMYAMLADHFARRGLAVLRTDARGFGSSTGPHDCEQYTTADRIEDNRAVLAYLRTRREIDPGRIVLFGHSEGAMIAAALAASSKERIALTILLSTSALPGNEVFAQQFADNLRRRGGTAEAAEAVRKELLRFADFLVHDRDNRAQFEAIALDFLAAHGVPKEDLDPKLAQSLLDGFLKSPWTWYFVANDPRTDLMRITTPVFAIFAGADENVPWRTHLPALVGALSEAGNADFAATVLPDQDHFYLEFEGHRVEQHQPGKMAVAEELFNALDAELGRRRLTSSPCPGK